MKLQFYCIVVLISILTSSCSTLKPATPDNELLNFAKANCFFWYFKKMNYDLKDIGAITGGIVELGSYSPEIYRNVAFLVKNYKPSISTKNNVDIELLKCFKLETDENFLDSLRKLK